jgi:hypothetical protein
MKKISLFFFSVLLTCCFTSRASTNLDTSIYVAGVKQSLSVCIPADYDPLASYPLVVALHYCGSNSKDERTALRPMVDNLNVILVCPNSVVSGNPMNDPDIILTSIDTARSMFNIDSSLVYLTGMSCNAQALLVMGLNEIYPFRGIFPWEPYIGSFTSTTYNLNSKIPTVISTGTADPNYGTILKIYDSLEVHGANVDLVLVPGIDHSLSFPEFCNEMIRCMHYLNDTDVISIDTVPMVTMYNTNPPVEIKVKVTHKTGLGITYRTRSSNTLLAANPIVTLDGDSVILTIVPNGALRDGKFKIVLEASETDGTGIEQRIIIVNMLDKPVSAILENSVRDIEIFPVPAENQIFIKCQENNISVQIFDINGRKVFSSENFNTASPINISEFSKGAYFLKAQGVALNTTVRLIKE